MTGHLADGDGRLVLTKHEAAGNDFLVVVDGAPERPGGRAEALGIDGGVARALCERHRGIGADGLILTGPAGDGADVTMQLWNADGSDAEMSGNGVRCLAQAAVGAGLVRSSRFTVATAAGARTVDYRPAARGGVASASVDMGTVRLGPERPAGPGVRGPGRRAVDADVGNPHLVVLVEGDLDDVDLQAVAAEVGAARPAGVNVEVVVPGPAPGSLTLRVWERGVGETLACGTGSCAAAAAARRWGLVGDRVDVANPGGVLEVSLGEESGDGVPVVLAGPVRWVGEVRVDLGALLSLEAVVGR